MSDSVWPHRRQPTRLPRPWDSPDKITGVGCHFLLQCVKVKSEREIAQSCQTLHDPIDCSLPGSSIHGIFQARVLEWIAIAFPITCLSIKLLLSDLLSSNLSPNQKKNTKQKKKKTILHNVSFFSSFASKQLNILKLLLI